jgi:hypothetical protein
MLPQLRSGRASILARAVQREILLWQDSWRWGRNEATVPQPVVKTRQHFAQVVTFSPAEIKKAVSEVEGFNAKFAVLITRGVGTMACAYLFALIAFVSLPAILIQAGVLTNSDVPRFLTKPGLILIVAWIAQTFLQLVLLSIILVGQRVQSAASDERAEKEFTDTEAVLDALNLKTEGGLTTILEAVESKRTGGLSDG